MKIKLKSKHNFLRHALAGAAGLAMLAGTATAATTPPRQNTCRLDRARLLLTFGS